MSKRGTRRRSRFACLDCGTDTGRAREFYFVHTTLWLAAVGSTAGMLCVGCLEARIGRQLVPGDFTEAYLNDPRRTPMSDRLRSRVTGVASRCA